MCRRTSSFTEFVTCANEDAFDRYDAASANAGEGEYGADIPTRRVKSASHISRRISLYYVTNKGYYRAFTPVRQLAPPEMQGHGSERVGDIVRATHLEHFRPDHCRALSHNDPGLLKRNNLVGSSA
jgi:hypothetical protein